MSGRIAGDMPGPGGTHFGHCVEYNRSAAEDSVRRVMHFLNERR